MENPDLRKSMPGRRVADDTDAADMVAGDYCKITSEDFRRPDGRCCFVGRAPTGELGTFARTNHNYEEHEDGTITVTPSIFFNQPNGWHGYLERGFWRSV